MSQLLKLIKESRKGALTLHANVKHHLCQNELQYHQNKQLFPINAVSQECILDPVPLNVNKSIQLYH